jgi:DAK2 domain fusion protein YloV
MYSKLSGEQLRTISENIHRYFSKRKEYINSINVFPVPDGDTGLNMDLTIRGAIAETEGKDRFSSASEYLSDLSKAMLLNSRGCSGVMLSLYLKGVAEVLKTSDFSAGEIARALKNGYDQTFGGTNAPQEGTILTIMREFYIKFGELADPDRDAYRPFKRCIPHLKRVLRKTPEMMPLLKSAGVVDSGGAGFITLLEGLAWELMRSRGRPVIPSLWFLLSSFGAAVADAAFRWKSRLTRRPGVRSPRQSGSRITYRFCTELVLEAGQALPEDEVKEQLESHGDSLILLRDGTTYKIHIHTNNPDDVMEMMAPHGTIEFKKVDDMRLQHSHFIGEAGEPAAGAPAGTDDFERDGSFLCIVDGEGFKAILADLGADAVLTYRRRYPSAREVTRAIRGLRSRNVIVAADSLEITESLKGVTTLGSRHVTILDTDSVVSIIDVLFHRTTDETGQQHLNGLEQEPNRAKHYCITGKTGGPAKDDGIEDGRLYAVYNHRLIASDMSLERVIAKGIEEVKERETLVTIYRGKSTQASDLRLDKLAEGFPELEFEEYYGGQHRHKCIITLE